MLRSYVLNLEDLQLLILQNELHKKWGNKWDIMLVIMLECQIDSAKKLKFYLLQLVSFYRDL